MTGQPDPRWDDERVTAAFRQAFDRRAPSGLVRETMAAVEAAGRPRRTRLRLGFAGLAAAAVVVIVATSVGLSGLLRQLPSPTPSRPAATPSSTVLPAALQLPVISVEDAIRHRDTALDDTELAVHGFLALAGPISCPFQPASISPVLPHCPDQFSWLMRDPEILVQRTANSISGHPPTGPALNPLFRPPVSDAPLAAASGDETQPAPAVVVLGHFDDHRVGFCAAADLDTCRRQFVVDRIVSVKGQPIDPAPLLELDDWDQAANAPTTVPTRLTVGEVGDLTSPASDGRILTLGAVLGGRLPTIEPGAAADQRLVDQPVVWIVLRLDAVDGRPTVRTILLADRTGEAWVPDGQGVTRLSTQPASAAPSRGAGG